MKEYGIIFIILLAGAGNSTLAQDDSGEDHTLRAEIGIGFGSLVYSAGAYFLFDQTSLGASIVGARFIGMSELGIDFDLAGTVPDLPQPRERLWIIGAVVGKTYSSRSFVFTATTGLSAIGGVQRGIQVTPAGSLVDGEISTHNRHRSLDKISMGIPIEFQLIVYPVDNVGFGASYLVHLNTRKSFNGATLGFGISIP